MTLRRMNRAPEAAKVLEPIREGMEIIENDGYYRLLLMYKGAISLDSLLDETLKQHASPGSYSILYGIGNWHLYNSKRDEALKIFRRMVEGDQWTSFGYIAAEADLKRLAELNAEQCTSHDIVSTLAPSRIRSLLLATL